MGSWNVDDDLSQEAGMDGNLGRLLQAARDLDNDAADRAHPHYNLGSWNVDDDLSQEAGMKVCIVFPWKGYYVPGFLEADGYAYYTGSDGSPAPLPDLDNGGPEPYTHDTWDDAWAAV